MMESYGATPDKLGSEVVAAEETHYRRVTLFVCFLCLVVVGEGYDVGVINGASVRMVEDLKLSTWEISLVIFMTPLNFMPGALAGGAAADAWGRKLALMASCCLLIVGPLGMAFSVSLTQLLLTRAFVGFGIGMGFVVVSMYIAEVAPTHLRGRLTALEEVFLNVGILAGYLANYMLLGTRDDWRWMLGYGCVLPFLVLAALCFPQVPESPRWLHMKGRKEEAQKVLTLFVGREEALRSIEAMSGQENQDFVTWSEVFSSCRDRDVRRMLTAGIVVGCGQMLCGYIPMVFYSSTILKTTMNDKAAFEGTCMMGAMKLLVVLMVLVVVERVGRRPMLLTSVSVCGVACAWLAYVFAIDAHGNWQIFGFMLFMAGFSMGLGPMTFVYISEVFETKWRAKGIAISLFASRSIGAASSLVFPLSIEGIGVSNTFVVLAFLNVLVIALVWVFVFETQGSCLESMTKLYSARDTCNS